MLLNQVEAHLLDGHDAEGRADVLHAVHDPEGFAALAAARQEEERKEQSAKRAELLLDIGGEIG